MRRALALLVPIALLAILGAVLAAPESAHRIVAPSAHAGLPQPATTAPTWPGEPSETDSAPVPAVEPPAATEPPPENPVLALQRSLLAAGYDPGPLDGQDGPLTQRALRRSQGVPDPAPSPPPPPPVVQAGDIWWQLALCESGGNPATNTGNGYSGAFQFMPSTWWSVGGTGYPHEHSYEVQLGFAQALQARSGWGQWPACARRLGLL